MAAYPHHHIVKGSASTLSAQAILSPFAGRLAMIVAGAAAMITATTVSKTECLADTAKKIGKVQAHQSSVRPRADLLDIIAIEAASIRGLYWTIMI
jgi:hypothetical protein